MFLRIPCISKAGIALIFVQISIFNITSLLSCTDINIQYFTDLTRDFVLDNLTDIPTQPILIYYERNTIYEVYM